MASPLSGPHRGQLLLLCVIVLMVGGMLGLERTVLPIKSEVQLHLSYQKLLFFIFAFGLSKAVASLTVGEIADRKGRKFTLLLGMALGLPVYVLVVYADSWNVVVLANVFLGLSQGFAWPATIYMMMDLVDEDDDGFMLGLNEFFGYLAVALVAFGSGYHVYVHNDYDAAFSIGIFIAAAGLVLSFFVHETLEVGRAKARKREEHPEHRALMGSRVPRHRRDSDPHPVPAHKRGFFHNVWISFKRVSFSNMHVLSCCVAGLVSALKDGIVWGLLPIFFHRYDPDIEQISLLIALYPTTWAVVQLFSGWLYDRYGARWLIASGCWLEGFAILYVVWCPRLLLRDLPPSQSFYVFLTGSVLLGTGTALLYPTLHVAISHGVPPKYFASSIGIYKLWRELGYATGALLGGGVADAFGISAALTVGAVMIFVVGLLTCAFIADDRDEEMITMEELSSRICGSNPDAAEAVRRSGERTEEVSESDADDRVVPPRGIAPARPPVIM